MASPAALLLSLALSLARAETLRLPLPPSFLPLNSSHLQLSVSLPAHFHTPRIRLFYLPPSWLSRKLLATSQTQPNRQIEFTVGLSPTENHTGFDIQTEKGVRSQPFNYTADPRLECSSDSCYTRLRDPAVLPACVTDSDCLAVSAARGQDYKCFQYMCFPWRRPELAGGFRPCKRRSDCGALGAAEGGDGGAGDCYRHNDRRNVIRGICVAARWGEGRGGRSGVQGKRKLLRALRLPRAALH
jgi:hypothetical protein